MQPTMTFSLSQARVIGFICGLSSWSLEQSACHAPPLQTCKTDKER